MPPHRTGAFFAFALVALALLSGCGVVGGASSTATPTSTATATASSTRTVTPTPSATVTPSPSPTLEPSATPPPASSAPPAAPPATGTLLPRGRTLTMRIAGFGATSATLSFRGDVFSMIKEGDSFWVPVGASATAALGDFPAIYRLFDASGAEIGAHTETVSVVYTDYPVEYITLPPGQIESITSEQVQYEINTRAAVVATFTPAKLWSGPFIFPSAGAVSAPYGVGRSYNGNPVSSYHNGTDFAIDEGTPIVAAASGRVAFAGFFAQRGNSVIIDHGAGVFTGYHHLSAINVVEGQQIAQGEVVGACGATGLATGPHLHWELIVGGVTVDPVFWTYDGVAP